MSKITAAIFDMDGLMIDSEPLQSEAYKKVLAARGVEVEVDGPFIQILGVGAAENWRILKERYRLSDNIETLKNEKSDAYEALLGQGVELMPGLVDLLNLLTANSVRLALASSSPKKHIDMVLEAKYLAHYFEVIVSFDDVTNTKPDPEIFLKAAAKLRVSCSECVVFEDAASGVKAAKAAGMKCVAVPNAADVDKPEFQDANLVTSSLNKLDWHILNELDA